jgi:hypothetical protein
LSRWTFSGDGRNGAARRWFSVLADAKSSRRYLDDTQ